MKRLVGTSLLLGYIMLVPFCLFGSALLMQHIDTAEMAANPAHHMHDCGVPFSGCAHTAETGAMDTAVHHVSMYLSITQTPLAIFSFVVAVILVLSLVLFGTFYNWLSAFTQNFSLRTFNGRRDLPRNATKQDILAWLSLFETSPNFA